LDAVVNWPSAAKAPPAQAVSIACTLQ
jgi:hypothetical protein